MRASEILLLAVLVGLWGLALVLWPTLPERIPVHFDLRGVPDRHVARSPGSWFLLPALATGLVALLGLALPRWTRRLARQDSPHLNVPGKADFARLAPEARERAVAPMVALLQVLAAEVALLFAWIQLGTARVATGDWQRLPPALLWASLALVLGTTLAFLPLGRRAVRRELARAGR